MAKSRRPQRRGRKPRMRGDWVFRGVNYDTAGAVVDDFGSYQAVTKNVTGGPAGANICILYDSANYQRVAQGGQFVSTYAARAHRAEGPHPLIKRVRGTIIFRPSTWALGSSVEIGLRFGVFEQVPDGGGIFLDPEYNMWTAVPSSDATPAVWANRRDWVREVHWREDFLENRLSWTKFYNFAVNRRLLPHQCFAAYIETNTGSPTLVVQPWLSSYVIDEG